MTRKRGGVRAEVVEDLSKRHSVPGLQRSKNAGKPDGLAGNWVQRRQVQRSRKSALKGKTHSVWFESSFGFQAESASKFPLPKFRQCVLGGFEREKTRMINRACDGGCPDKGGVPNAREHKSRQTRRFLPSPLNGMQSSTPGYLLLSVRGIFVQVRANSDQAREAGRGMSLEHSWGCNWLPEAVTSGPGR